KRHGTRGARVHFDEVDFAVLHRELDVHQALDLERAGQSLSLALDLGDDLGRQAVGRDRAGAVARMDARFLDMLEHAGDHHVGAVGDRIHVHFDCVTEILVDQHGAVARDLHRGLDVVVELLGRVHDLH
ncbi:hypothetical protein QU39_00050, partial [Staphylococcus aureus]